MLVSDSADGLEISPCQPINFVVFVSVSPGLEKAKCQDASLGGGFLYYPELRHESQERWLADLVISDKFSPPLIDHWREQ